MPHLHTPVVGHAGSGAGDRTGADLTITRTLLLALRTHGRMGTDSDESAMNRLQHLGHGGPGAGGRTAAGLAVSCSYLAHTTAGTERSPKFNAPKCFRSGSFGGCASPQPGVRWCHYVARERCVRGWDRYLPPSWTRGSSRPTNGH